MVVITKNERATAARITLHADRRERRRVVVLERQAPGKHALLEQRVLHRAERGHIDAAVLREQRAREPVGSEDDEVRPAGGPS